MFHSKNFAVFVFVFSHTFPYKKCVCSKEHLLRCKLIVIGNSPFIVNTTSYSVHSHNVAHHPKLLGRRLDGDEGEEDGGGRVAKGGPCLVFG